ncbi:hypothetical protein BMETH_1150_0 [methanotrophic bacterial endosymbiont of Bathymodiolus sp.]|nr:hypothetical protein BMETH_1150_0 [methanotrophic bacterial endosymbiont of Bathymodiolus sp.]
MREREGRRSPGNINFYHEGREGNEEITGFSFSIFKFFMVI